VACTGGARNIHPTVKPVELMRWLVRLVTPVGGVVLDPFLGSGTTGMACRYENRRFIGIEREADYIAIAERRIAAIAPLFSQETGT
jgi:DNA modification methylase